MTNNNKYLYHVSLTRANRLFKPRVPDSDSRAASENHKIKRICMSTSVENCLSGIPDAHYLLDRLCDDRQFGIPFLVYIYSINIEDIKSGYIVSPYTLVQKDWVRDALVTDEHWIIKKKIHFNEPKLIRITSIQSEKINIPDFGFVSKVTDIKYEESVDTFEKEYVYTFINQLHLDKFRIIIEKIGRIINIVQIPDRNYFIMHFIVNANEDKATLWDEYQLLRSLYANNYDLENMDFEFMNDAVNDYLKTVC